MAHHTQTRLATWGFAEDVARGIQLANDVLNPAQLVPLSALLDGACSDMQGSKFAVATVANATTFCHLLPGCSTGSKHLLLP